MNSDNTYDTIRSLYSTLNTSSSFHPPDTQWIKCISYTYHPHSNECGLCCLLALAVMAIHPAPSFTMLLPYMSENIAQITRWWVANSILDNNVTIPILPDITNISIFSPPSLVKILNPSNLAPLNDASNNFYQPLPELNTLPDTNPTIKFPYSSDFPSLEDNSPVLPINNDTSSLTQLSLTNNTVSSTASDNTPSNTYTQRQQPISKWTTHRPFIPGTPSSNQEKSIIAPDSPHETYTNHLIPFGTPLPIIDQSRILRICMQNTQFSFQINSDGLEILHIIENLRQ